MMATSSSLLLLVVLPALFATALGACDYNTCLKQFILMGTEKEICDGARAAVSCAETTLVNNTDCKSVINEINTAVARVKKITQCYGCGAGNSVSVSFLTLCFGLTLATYFSRSK